MRRRRLGRVLHRVRGDAIELATHREERQHVGERDERRAQGTHQTARMAQRIADRVHAALPTHTRARLERTATERREVHTRAERGIRVVQDLEAAVQQESLHPIGRHAPAGPWGGLEQRDVQTRPREIPGRREAREPRSHHDDVDGFTQAH